MRMRARMMILRKEKNEEGEEDEESRSEGKPEREGHLETNLWGDIT